MAAIKTVIVALVVAGLIFRTKTTVGLLMLGGLLSLIAVSPVLGLSLAAALITAGVVMKNGVERGALALDDPDFD
ncbi:hypothetical protein [Sphingomonas sp. R-74633]|uniref:hypothetical protein n=1 Tax=Sphingomonas sp. R-74633 TaxID=2751188 RepID=UPI0015D37AAB|nr:hypothetical protein [Sphingomonas sp. R-74633]